MSFSPPPHVPLAPDELQPYHRHPILPEVGEVEQSSPEIGAHPALRRERARITPRALAARLANGESPALLVTFVSPTSSIVCRVPARLVPLDILPDVMHTFDPSAES